PATRPVGGGDQVAQVEREASRLGDRAEHVVQPVPPGVARELASWAAASEAVDRTHEPRDEARDVGVVQLREADDVREQHGENLLPLTRARATAFPGGPPAASGPGRCAEARQHRAPGGPLDPDLVGAPL